MKLTIKIVAVWLFAATSASAQMPYVTGQRIEKNDNRVHGGWYKRLSLGYGMHFVHNTLDVTYRENSELQRKTLNIKGEESMAVFLSTFFPLGYISERSAIALDVGATASMFTFRHDTLITRNGPAQADIPIMLAGLPISIDFKTGGEVTLNKEQRHVFSGGVGVAPAMIQNDVDMRIGAAPFIKLEAGFLAGMVFKVRGMLYLGQGRYINDKDLTSGPWLTRKSNGPFGASVGLVIVPFAFGWDKPF
jgi:hypothetical protein